MLLQIRHYLSDILHLVLEELDCRLIRFESLTLSKNFLRLLLVLVIESIILKKNYIFSNSLEFPRLIN